VQPHPNQSQDDAVVDALLEDGSKLCPGDRIEEFCDVGINNLIPLRENP
jgi:hypothetical protein